MKKAKSISIMLALILFSTLTKMTPVKAYDSQPIYGLKVVATDEKNYPTPSGYVKLDLDLNKGAGGKYVYLYYTTDPGKANADSPITQLYILDGKNAIAPEGYTKINVDLNEGACGNYLYLCYSRNTNFQPITSIQALTGNQTLIGYTKLDMDLNEGACGAYIYLYYQR